MSGHYGKGTHVIAKSALHVYQMTSRPDQMTHFAVVRFFWTRFLFQIQDFVFLFIWLVCIAILLLLNVIGKKSRERI